METPRVLLIHGLHTSPAVMKRLGARLAAHGFAPHYFGYASTRAPLAEPAAALADFLRREQLAPCHFVAHSLGGLLLRQLARTAPELMQGRAVTIGTPHQGSLAARRLRRLMSPLIGGAWQGGLDGSLPAEPLPIACGLVAGTRRAGLGRLFARLPKPNDGTVALSEAAFCGCPMLLVPHGHSGMLFDAAVAEQTAHFLRYGRFQAA